MRMTEEQLRRRLLKMGAAAEFEDGEVFNADEAEVAVPRRQREQDRRDRLEVELEGLKTAVAEMRRVANTPVRSDDEAVRRMFAEIAGGIAALGVAIERLPELLKEDEEPEEEKPPCSWRHRVVRDRNGDIREFISEPVEPETDVTRATVTRILQSR